MISSLVKAPSAAQLLGLSSLDNEDLEKLSTEELRHIHAVERDRLDLTGQLGVAGGFVGVLGLGRYLGVG